MGPEILVPITFFLSTTALIFGWRYMVSREKMAMIERGMEPGLARPRPSAPMPFVSLKFGLLLVGLGLGLIVALFTVRATGIEEEEGVAVYFGCLSIFGGIGLIVSYAMEKNWLDKQKDL
ncbi:DUF6249 domain-containing protein [Pedobacter gandavensis]|uniref:DUF6249 domain-containing protein n=1 Tax=Pedobacter gandavensis TaxID=2679963 RepID=UPI00292ECD0B|nr:DUF6249 domain-containing protein [Pedobacter gandavensis]